MFDVVSENSAVDIVSHGTLLKGTFTFGDTVKIDGRVEGKISTSKEGTGSILLIGQDAYISAEITCDSIVVEGLVNGNITARGTVEIRETGVLFGNVRASNLAVHPGGALEGTCNIIHDQTPGDKNR